MSIVRHVSRAKAARLVTGGRLVACSFALIAALLALALRRGALLPVVVVGTWWLVAALLYREARRGGRPRTSPWILAFDLLAVGLLITSTGGVTSAYFPLIVLAPYAANILYGRRAIYWSIAGGLTVFAAAVLTAHTPGDPSVTVMRLGIVVLLAAAVVRRADYEQRVQEDIESLATWTPGVEVERESALREILARATVTLRAPRAAIAWTETSGASWVARFDRHRGLFDLDEETEIESTVEPDAGGATAFLTDVRRRDGLRAVDGAIEEIATPIALPPFLNAQSAIGARFATQTARGWLYALDRGGADTDDLMLAEVVARLASAGLDQLNLADVIRDGAAANERIRLSRDLHDGLLQSLSGLALHVQVARRAVTADPPAAEAQLQSVVEQLAEGQRALRDFVEELRPELMLRREPLGARLSAIARSIESQWNVRVDLRSEPDEPWDELEPRLAGEVVSLVTEGLTNAAKHAAAGRIRAALWREDHSVRVEVEDDGRGFPFHGRYDLAQLTAEHRGPWSLKERVTALGGELTIDSTPHGSRVEVRIPL